MKNKIDLNAPAFGNDAQKVEPVVTEPTTEVAPVVEPVVTQTEEQQVPYRRFKKFHDEAIEAREQAEYWRREAEELRNAPAPVTYTDDAALSAWKEMYGDTEASLKYFKLDQARQQQFLSQAQELALQAARQERFQETEAIESNIDRLDGSFEDLEDGLGRSLTDAEQSAVLDIVDEYTPKDRQGNYAGEILPFDKAWDIYELKNGASKAPKIANRNAVAGLSGTNTQGEGVVTQQEEQDKEFNPSWGALNNALKKRFN